MTKKEPTPAATPEPLLLSIKDSMALLGIERTYFYHLRKEFGITPVPWSARGKKPKGLLFRREDILKLAAGPQGGHDAPAPAEPAEPVVPTTSDPKKVLAIDAGFKVSPGFEHITVEEWHEANRETQRMKQSAHLPGEGT